nr:MAG TPA: hypothetical protein [Caudoviricetes sp.]
MKEIKSLLAIRKHLYIYRVVPIQRIPYMVGNYIILT